MKSGLQVLTRGRNAPRVNRRLLHSLVSIAAIALVASACHKNPTSPTPPPTGPKASTFSVVFGENPVPFRSSGCNAVEPQGWYTTARLQETSGVMFRVNTLTQKLDGNVSSMLAESFNSRFGACSGGTFAPGVIPANGAVCASVGVCTASTFSNYQFQIAGTDANGQAATFDSPLLNFGARSAVTAAQAPGSFVFAIGPQPIR
jgi:hypothetical protein